MKKPMPKKKESTHQRNNINDLFAELKNEYLETFPEKITAIEKLWQSKNRREIENEYHKMKGTGTTYGVKEVTEVAEIMEALAYHGHYKLGLGVLISLELFKKICDLYIHKTPFELAKDKSFKTLRHMHDELESA